MPRVFDPLAFRPDSRYRPRSTTRPDGLGIRWLGTAGHVIEGRDTTLLIDPYLTRASLLTAAFRRLRPTPDRWRGYLPLRVDAVLLGHSHFDHLLDAPTIARETGAKVIGSATTSSFARASGVPEEQIVTVPAGGATITVGSATVRFVPSVHARIAAGRVPFPGEVLEPPELPARLHRYRMGGAFGILVTLDGRSVYHNGSADLVDAELAGCSADVVLLGLAGRRATTGYVRRVLDALSPSLVLPTHHDLFFAPLEEGVRTLPGTDLHGLAEELPTLRSRPSLVTPTYEETLVVPRDGTPRGAVLIDR